MSNQEKTFVVYKHTCTINNKSYIGITCDYEQRCYNHQNKSSRCTNFARAIKKYGWSSFSHEILATGLTLQSANHFEKFYIKEHKSLSPNGYNLKDGGDNSLYSEESRKRMSEARIGEKHTLETKQKIGKSNRGYNNHNFGKFGADNPKSKKYLIIDPNGNHKVIVGLFQYCRENNLNGKNMFAVASGKQEHCKKYHCENYFDGKYYQEDIDDMGRAWNLKMENYAKGGTGEKNKTSKSYIITSPLGDVIIITGLSAFCRDNLLNTGNMSEVANGNRKHHKGYKCEYYNEIG